MSTIFASSPVSLTLFQLPSLIKARIPSDVHQQTSGEGICHTLPSQLRQVLYELPPGYAMCHSASTLSHSPIHNFSACTDLPIRKGLAVNLLLLCNVPQMLYFPLCGHLSLLLSCLKAGLWVLFPYFQGPMLYTLLYKHSPLLKFSSVTSFVC